jgi:mono/diheme cytochrome c family protein
MTRVPPAPPASRSRLQRRRALTRGLSAVLLTAIAGPAPADEAAPDWATVGAVFRERCVMCHAQEAAARGVRLDSYAGVLAGGENGPVLIPGDGASSELLRRLTGESRPRMPFLSRPLPPEELALIERWIAAGLPEHAPPQPGAVAGAPPP